MSQVANFGTTNVYVCAAMSVEPVNKYAANLPGWRWARIKQLVLVGLSSSWHSEVCNALGHSFRVPTA